MKNNAIPCKCTGKSLVCYRSVNGNRIDFFFPGPTALKMMGIYAQHQVPTRHDFVAWVLFVFTYLYFIYWGWIIFCHMQLAFYWVFKYQGWDHVLKMIKWKFKTWVGWYFKIIIIIITFWGRWCYIINIII